MKAPELGKVKTRLTPFISSTHAARLQEAFILDLLKNTTQLTETDTANTIGKGLNTRRVIACAPFAEHTFFQRCVKEHELQLISQQGKDLGERMRNAFSWGFENGFQKVVVIGCDSPTLPPAFIQHAFEKLSEVDLVIGPGLDGGYYLIGMRRFMPAVFTGLAWGTETVLTRTLAFLNQQKQTYSLLPFWYDIDRPADLVFLKEHLQYLHTQKQIGAQQCFELPTPQATAEVLASLKMGDIPGE